MPIEVLLFSIL